MRLENCSAIKKLLLMGYVTSALFALYLLTGCGAMEGAGASIVQVQMLYTEIEKTDEESAPAKSGRRQRN